MVSGSCTRRQITGTSDISVDDAIARALSVAAQNFREPDWFDVLTARGFVSNGQVTHYQVTLDLGYSKPPTPNDASLQGQILFSARGWRAAPKTLKRPGTTI